MRLLRPAHLVSRLLLATVSAVLLNEAFPVAGPLPPLRGVLSMVALVPLLCAVLHGSAVQRKRRLLEAALVGYACGVLWYGLNCYWIYATMHIYGGLPPLVSAGILLLFCLVLGLYFALFAGAVALVRAASGSLLPALCAAPFLWVAVEYVAAHLTCVPWDQLGYAEVDNLWLTQLAPWTGVYGLSFVLAGVNALGVGGLLASTRRARVRSAFAALATLCGLQIGSFVHPAADPAPARAVLVQPDLKVGAGMADDNEWTDTPRDRSWTRHTDAYLQLSRRNCTPYLYGLPDTGAATVHPTCAAGNAPPALVVWPESPSPFRTWDARFTTLVQGLALQTGATSIVGAPSINAHGQLFNAAIVTAPNGMRVGEYDKIHLVPWGEYIPFAHFFAFAGTLTQNVGLFTHGTRRQVFLLPDGHTVGIFICYEAVFADEIRHFAKNGAEALVNISDDGWYGDTSAPWQHLNMARMRAIENHRWILRDTNSGVTAAIDPLGRVTEAIPRHQLDSLAASYGYVQQQTFYTRHGDVWAWLCEILAAAALGLSVRELLRKRQVG